MSSPYLLWHYMHHLSPPDKSQDQVLHPTLTPTKLFPSQYPGYLQEQNLNQSPHQLCPGLPYPYMHEQPHSHLPHKQQIQEQLLLSQYGQYVAPHDNLSVETHPQYTSLNVSHSKDYNGNNKRSTTPTAFMQLKNRHQKLGSVCQSPKKGSSFTIDAILNKDSEKVKEESCEALSPASDSFSENPISTNVINSYSSTCHPAPHKFGVLDDNLRTNNMSSAHSPSPFSIDNSAVIRRRERFLDLAHPYLYHHHHHPNQHHAVEGAKFQFQSPPQPGRSSGLLHIFFFNRFSFSDKQERKNVGKTKRIRTIFTPEQLERLEAEFERQQYMVGTERYYLAASLNLTEAQVKVWFQNRRIKWRKQHLEQQQARLASGELYQDIDDDTDDSDNEDDGGRKKPTCDNMDTRGEFPSADSGLSPHCAANDRFDAGNFLRRREVRTSDRLSRDDLLDRSDSRLNDSPSSSCEMAMLSNNGCE
ncbi:uncharacterized protein LOC101854766 [Aplysia californica]|uniref:Uncharacterized protein LOC101854766 n=1 Tax=Aplysia californica TaxID=6500 RepID=A0ABM0ZXX6_APLCA|nr:uncharacterized protein LOC101854766 [Aplysia californica]